MDQQFEQNVAKLLVPDIEGDQGYPPVPQLTDQEDQTIKKFTVDTMRTHLKKQIKKDRKKFKFAKSQQKKDVNLELVQRMDHENDQKIHRQNKANEEANLPQSSWDAQAKVEQIRRQVELKTGQVIDSQKIDRALVDTCAKVKHPSRNVSGSVMCQT